MNRNSVMRFPFPGQTKCSQPLGIRGWGKKIKRKKSIGEGEACPRLCQVLVALGMRRALRCICLLQTWAAGCPVLLGCRVLTEPGEQANPIRSCDIAPNFREAQRLCVRQQRAGKTGHARRKHALGKQRVLCGGAEWQEEVSQVGFVLPHGYKGRAVGLRGVWGSCWELQSQGQCYHSFLSSLIPSSLSGCFYCYYFPLSS